MYYIVTISIMGLEALPQVLGLQRLGPARALDGGGGEAPGARPI